MNKEKVDVIILSNTKNLHYYDMTKKAIDSLIESEASVEFNVYLVETNINLFNEFPEGYQSATKVINPNIPFNYNKFINIGLKNCKSDYVVMVNNDVVFEKNWLSNMINAMNDNNADSASPYSPDCPDLKQCGNIPDVWEGYEVNKQVFGFCIVATRKALNVVDFDEQFEFWYQDNDYAMQLKENNLKHILVKNSVVNHLGQSSHQLVDDKDKYKFTNGMKELFNKKWNNGSSGTSGIHNTSRDWTKRSGSPSIKRALKCDGWMSESELLWLANTVYNLKPKSICAEVGSWHGRSSVSISENLPYGAICFCCDTWAGSVGEQDTHHASARMMSGDHAFFEFMQNCWSFVENGKTIPIRMTSDNSAKLFKEKNIKLDFLFIDASHDYDSVKHDIECWLPCMKVGSIISGHDYNQPYWEGVTRAVNEFFPDVKNDSNTSIWYHTVTEEDLKREIKTTYVKPSVYDCIPLFNELDLLELRLNELNSVVDRFIIVEATLTHGGQPKPLNFDLNKERFAKFLHKISYVVVNDYVAMDSWSIERHQRDCIMRAMSGVQDNSIVIISDLDEIPKAEKVREYIDKDCKEIMSFEQNLYYYYLNCKSKDFWQWSKICRFKDVREKTPCGIRYHEVTEDTLIKDAGWHFSYIGGIDKIIEKIHATAHQEYNTPEFTDKSKVEYLVKNAQDVFGRPLQYEYVDIDETYPKFVLDNLKSMAEKGLICDKSKENIEKVNPHINIVQIGANRGDDDLSSIIFRDKWKIKNLILVEPLSLHNNSLETYYDDIYNKHIENVVISEKETNELIPFYYHTNDAPSYEVASLNKEHILKHQQWNSKLTEDGIIKTELQSLTLNQLFKKYDLSDIDILFIDAEGVDDKLIYSIEWDKYNIKKIYFENLHINFDKLNNFFIQKKYTVTKNIGTNGWMSLAEKIQNN